MHTERILIIEDDESILMGLEDDLKMEGFEIDTARDGLAGLSRAKERRHDLIVLDIMLPRMSGFDVCRQLRQEGITIPILMLTARGREADKVLGLELGADDYVTKPFSPRELLARINAILRRVKQTRQGIEVARFGDVEIDFRKYEVRKGNRPVYLTSLEFALLRHLINSKGEVLSRDAILDEVWGKEVYVDNRTVDTHIAHLRKKLEDDPAEPRYIQGVRGVGYKFHE
ncbi:MAG: response regulator transcription factor [Ignavibacteria bacterium]|nr:response regulator transcription factor [Ignavibacteria bacterium]